MLGVLGIDANSNRFVELADLGQVLPASMVLNKPACEGVKELVLRYMTAGLHGSTAMPCVKAFPKGRTCGTQVLPCSSGKHGCPAGRPGPFGDVHFELTPPSERPTTLPPAAPMPPSFAVAPPPAPRRRPRRRRRRLPFPPDVPKEPPSAEETPLPLPPLTALPPVPESSPASHCYPPHPD